MLTIEIEDFTFAINQIVDAFQLGATNGGLDVRHFELETNLVRPELLRLSA